MLNIFQKIPNWGGGNRNGLQTNHWGSTQTPLWELAAPDPLDGTPLHECHIPVSGRSTPDRSFHIIRAPAARRCWREWYDSCKCACKEACIALCYMKLHLVSLRHGPCLMGSHRVTATHFTGPRKDDSQRQVRECRRELASEASVLTYSHLLSLFLYSQLITSSIYKSSYHSRLVQCLSWSSAALDPFESHQWPSVRHISDFDLVTCSID